MAALRLKDPFHQAILDSANLTIIATQPDGVITYANSFALSLLGYQESELLNQQTPALFHDPEEVAARAQCLSAQLGYQVPVGFETFVILAKQGTPDENDWHYISKTGQRIPIHLSVTAIYDQDNSLIGFLGIGRDLTELRLSQQHEQESQQRFQLLAEAAFEAIVLSESGIITDVNQEFERLFQCPRTQAIGLSILEIVAPEYQDLVQGYIQSGHNEPYEARVKTLKGKTFYAEVCGKSAEYAGKTVRISALRDISERKYYEQALESQQTELEDLNNRLALLANTDELTQLPNKRALMQCLNRYFGFSKRHDKALSVLVFDIDFFKKFNDQHGHLEGDRVLQLVAKTAGRGLRRGDYLGRFGGEEFVIILPETHLAQALLVAEKVRLNIQNDRSSQHQLTVSIGAAELLAEHDEPEQLLHDADMQLYKAKQAGRNRCYPLN
ncbi:PAS domain S-box-containing protein/diguanylate cyclase (GGDEF) domain-containing protein [Oceanospirillum multiglobuliferum]|uniref:diguanylate cyclase n=1 Tax=Oceanospirillum multiglobuliferum TaxID=64969 RepID=A0A1T4LXX7_9GAMM|nr:diguanylate cyclase [Oceanospirillum multiglobuliferum]OPX56315.1 hypothetical protein BTE48_04920 [Oceanospirillum multiglobuliferum]SJZ59580.1 PAS domain S-box-containing protein/diguanylate cyclase (GGDEF) domain-containing protein [Oceanospirillum multiglobuliferum]